MVISIACSSDTWRRIAGIVFFPASCEARQRRSPAISWNRPFACGRTRIGCTTPFAVIDAASSASCSRRSASASGKDCVDLIQRNLARLAAHLRFIRHSSAHGAAAAGVRAAAANQVPCPGRGVLGRERHIIIECLSLVPGSLRPVGSCSWNSRPDSALRLSVRSMARIGLRALGCVGGGGLALEAARALDVVARQELAGQLEVGLGPARSRVIKRHRLAMAGRLGQPDIARNHGLEKPLLEIFAQRLGHLLRQIRPVVVHGQQHAFDR